MSRCRRSSRLISHDALAKQIGRTCRTLTTRMGATHFLMNRLPKVDAVEKYLVLPDLDRSGSYVSQVSDWATESSGRIAAGGDADAAGTRRTQRTSSPARAG